MALDPLTYPRPRLRRPGPPPASAAFAEAAGGALTPPRGRVLSFGLSANLSSRTTRSFGPFVGPLIIRGIHCEFDSHTDPISNSLEIGWSESAVSEVSVALTTARKYTLLTESAGDTGVIIAAAGQGLINWTAPNTLVNWQKQLHLVVQAGTVFVCLGLVQGSAVGALRVSGELTLLEGVPLDGLGAFTG